MAKQYKLTRWKGWWLPVRARAAVEITTHDLEGTLRTLLAANVPLSHLRIRPPNLEDLFLELTGKELRP